MSHFIRFLQPRRFLICYFLVGILGSLGAACSGNLIGNSGTYPNVNHQKRQSVSNAFFRSLMEKNLHIAQSVVSEQNHDKIEEWMIGREKVECPDRTDFEPESFSVGGSFDNGTKFNETRSYSLPCPTEEKIYCLQITDITYTKTEAEWVITDWGEITEYWDQYSCN